MAQEPQHYSYLILKYDVEEGPGKEEAVEYLKMFIQD
jgi:hypothetical protein